MADSLEPPAKRARLDEPVADVPGSPVDDTDDDFYETSTPVKPASGPAGVDAHAGHAPAAATSTNVPSQGSLHLPGLGLFNSAAEQQASIIPAVAEAGGNEDGEISDGASLYSDKKPAEPALAPVAQETQEADTAPPVEAVNELASSKPTESAANGQDPVAVDEGKAEFLRAAEANKDNENAEWQLDSEQSDSSDSSSDDSDTSDDDSDEGELLDPAELARLLMMESADDPGAATAANVRTANEEQEVFEKPDITVTDTTKKTELGKVEFIVDNMIVIKAKTSGEYQVLESGSALCLGNNTVIGKVAETLGRVQEPRYSVGFTEAAEIETLGITKDTPIYYVDEYTKFVDTEPLKNQKFTDASNLHDEETHDVEFSDDEKEAEFKRKQKDLKRARAEARAEQDGGNPSGAQEAPQARRHTDVPTAPKAMQYQGGGLNYGSDDEDDLGMYKPLARPDHFEHVVGAGAPVEDRSHVRRGHMRGRGGWPERGRGARGRGRGGGGGPDAGGRGNFRGNQRGRLAGPAGGHHAPQGPADRGRHHDHNRGGRNGQHKDNRAAASASPNRHNQGRPQQQSPSRGHGSRRKRNRQGSSPATAPAAPAAPTATATPASSAPYMQNVALNAATPAWTPPTAATPLQQPYMYGSPAPPPAVPTGAYVNPAFYGQATPQAAAPNAQQNAAQWIQYLQLVAALQGQGQANVGQANPAPPANMPQANQQPSGPQNGPDLNDILRVLGGAPPR
ncbi:NAF1-domain-containing protein [Sporormia fimetaria CBS 119925]|uniref:H/ACA ribonucleoprotein complex non-core subunit NAF1 n=1 Tax=Sporormia fimetaria CBS 119925 TaxID=1340428 RepID=A0A6A6VCK3_9PLEO|nr:NAF1-domain-containing protein [Sporormia fimetaria CBS 119925]